MAKLIEVREREEMSKPELLTATIQVPLPPSARAKIERLAKIEDRKPATVARRLILAALATMEAIEQADESDANDSD